MKAIFKLPNKNKRVVLAATGPNHQHSLLSGCVGPASNGTATGTDTTTIPTTTTHF